MNLCALFSSFSASLIAHRRSQKDEKHSQLLLSPSITYLLLWVELCFSAAVICHQHLLCTPPILLWIPVSHVKAARQEKEKHEEKKSVQRRVKDPKLAVLPWGNVSNFMDSVNVPELLALSVSSHPLLTGKNLFCFNPQKSSCRADDPEMCFCFSV